MEGNRRAQIGVLSLALFAFWLLLSGLTDPTHLVIGAAASVGVAVLYFPLLLFRRSGGPGGEVRPAWNLPYLGLLRFIPWLSWQIIKANVQVAALILNPRLPIDPSMVEFEKRLPGPVAQLILAHSITLTPGTVTVNVEEDRFLIHTLWSEAAREICPIGGEGEMTRRIGALFSSGPARVPVGPSDLSSCGHGEDES